MGKYVVYVRARDEQELRAAGLDPGWWVRDIVKQALEARARVRGDVPLPGVSAAKAAEQLTRLAEGSPSEEG